MTDPMFKTTAEAIAALQAAMEAADRNALALRQEVASDRKTDRRLYLGGLLLILVVFGTVLFSIRGTQQLVHTLADCTTEGGDCYTQQQARTGKIVEQIIEGTSRNVGDRAVRATIYMGQCSRLYPDISGPVYDLKLERCVAAKLAEERPLGQAPAK
jgi:hypothetical protein